MAYIPLLPTCFTDFSYYLAPPFTLQTKDSFCGKIESKLMDCLEAYGANQAKSKCAALMYDFTECSRATLQIKRVEAIRKERMRQYRAGLLSKPFDEYPPMDSYFNL